MYAEKTDYDDIEMSSRLRNILRRNGFESLEGLREYPKEHFIFFLSRKKLFFVRYCVLYSVKFVKWLRRQ